MDVEAETRNFVDLWRATGERRADWHATWRNWIRRAMSFQPTRASPPPDRSGRRGPIDPNDDGCGPIDKAALPFMSYEGAT